ncbi:flagellar hook-length control protein FliK [Amphritea balenae]|uniref:Flagellar hook-length control protein-like C-terminal domain-containing protein n=1 Tax=Amphritea balenae TaxID=452629 RepID=A0A3P1SSS7_9GAMM|nr:flagellar hook-length control protein FliK [Amphritea balenae]RRC99232.1 hypothetical protein EHS89_10295 [Amphritea balenae]GGK72863.1 hypothetical protein GCM10007941_23600 [Amphritea balenae]
MNQTLSAYAGAGSLLNIGTAAASEVGTKSTKSGTFPSFVESIKQAEQQQTSPDTVPSESGQRLPSTGESLPAAKATESAGQGAAVSEAVVTSEDMPRGSGGEQTSGQIDKPAEGQLAVNPVLQAAYNQASLTDGRAKDALAEIDRYRKADISVAVDSALRQLSNAKNGSGVELNKPLPAAQQVPVQVLQSSESSLNQGRFFSQQVISGGTQQSADPSVLRAESLAARGGSLTTMVDPRVAGSSIDNAAQLQSTLSDQRVVDKEGARPAVESSDQRLVQAAVQSVDELSKDQLASANGQVSDKAISADATNQGASATAEPSVSIAASNGIGSAQAVDQLAERVAEQVVEQAVEQRAEQATAQKNIVAASGDPAVASAMQSTARSEVERNAQTRGLSEGLEKPVVGIGSRNAAQESASQVINQATNAAVNPPGQQQTMTPGQSFSGVGANMGVNPADPNLTDAARQRIPQSVDDPLAKLAAQSLSSERADGRQESLLTSFSDSLAAAKTLRQASEPVQMVMPQGVRPGMPAWSQAVNDRVMLMSSRNGQFAEIQLDPPELGSLQVKLQVKNEQVSVVFNTPHGSVREALEQSMPRLKEMFEEQGLNLADSSVEDQSSGQQTDGESDDSAGYGGYAAADREDDVSGSEKMQQDSLALVDYYA